MERHGSTPLDAASPAAEAARTRHQVLVGTASASRQRFPDLTALVPEAPTVAFAAQPLLGDGAVLGVLAWGFASEQRFDGGTAEFLEAIGALTVQAMQGAAVFEREQTARRQAEAFAARMDEQFGLEWRWQGDTLRFAARSGRARGVRGDLTLAADEVQVTIELPFLLGVIGGTLRARADALLREQRDTQRALIERAGVRVTHGVTRDVDAQRRRERARHDAEPFGERACRRHRHR